MSLELSNISQPIDDHLGRLPELAVWSWDTRSGDVFWSPWLKRLLGYRDDETPPRWEEHSGIMKKSDWDSLENAVGRCLREGRPYTLMADFFSKVGRIVSVEIHGGAAEWQDGRVVKLSGVCIDRTNHSAARRDLHRAQQMLARTARIGRTGGWILNLEDDTLRWTAEMYTIHDVTRDFGLTFDNFTKLYAEEHRVRLVRALESLQTSGDPVECELELVTRRGRRSWIRVIAEMTYEIGSKPVVTGTAQDITSTRNDQIERDLLFNSGHDLMGIKGLDGVFRQINPEWFRCLGWTIQDLAGRPWRELVHPDDLDKARQITDQLARGEEVSGDITRLVHRDGSYRSFSWKAIPLLDERRIICILRDVTDEQRKSAELLEHQRSFSAVLEHSRAGYWDWGIQSETEYLSPTFKQMMGYPEAEMPDRPESWRGVIVPEDRPLVHAAYRRHVESRGRARFGVEFRCCRQDGSIIWVLCTGAVTEWSEDNQPLRMVGCHVEITESKTLALERHAAEEALATAALEERRRLAFYMHDGVGQLLTAVTMNAQRVASDLSCPAEVSRDLKVMLGLVRETHRRIRAITKGLVPDDVTMVNFVPTLVRLIDSVHAGFEVDCGYEGPESVALASDFVALEVYLIIQEAILNAVRHAHPDRIRVQILDPDDGIQEFQIWDDGEGIDLETVGEFSNGVGLRSMKARARSTNGTIDFRRNEAKGTTVILRLRASAPLEAS